MYFVIEILKYRILHFDDLARNLVNALDMHFSTNP